MSTVICFRDDSVGLGAEQTPVTELSRVFSADHNDGPDRLWMTCQPMKTNGSKGSRIQEATEVQEATKKLSSSEWILEMISRCL